MSAWSPRQREWLQAMGLSPMVHVGQVDAAGRASTARPDAARLHAALLRCVRDRGELLEGIAIDALRGDASAKRALWPRLRARRRA